MNSTLDTPRAPAAWLRPGAALLGRLGLRGQGLLLALLVLGSLLAGGTPWWPGLPSLGWALGALALYLLLAWCAHLAAGLARLHHGLTQTTAGHLDQRLAITGRDELAQLEHALEQLNQGLSGMVAHIRSNAALVAYSGEGLASNSRELSDRTEQQAASLEQTNASVQQLSETVQQAARTAQEVNQRSEQVRAITEQGRAAMTSAVSSMGTIQDSSRRVSDIIGVIDGIAFQTNILALNAAVEAARAGEQGRGFAVVASEVRSLAGRSAEAAREIKALIDRSGTQVSEGVGTITAANTTMDQVLAGIRDVAHNVGSISTAATGQSTSLLEISQALANLDQITQRNAQMVDGAAQGAQALRERAAKLADAVASFRLRQGTAEEALAMVQRALRHFQTHGAGALGDFNQAGGAFIDRDLYLFGIDDDGVYRVFGGQPAKIGTRMQDVAGIDGPALVAQIKACIANGGGWVEYDFRNPTTDTLQPKMSYVMRCGDINLGCGVYKSLVA